MEHVYIRVEGVLILERENSHIGIRQIERGKLWQVVSLVVCHLRVFYTRLRLS